MIEITLKLKDKVYADYLLYLEDHARTCPCEGSMDKSINHILEVCLIGYKTDKLKERLDLNAKDPMVMRGESMEEVMDALAKEGRRLQNALAIAQQQIEMWEAEYNEEEL